MDTTEILLTIATGIIVQFAIIYFAILGAQGPQRQHARIQTQLLVRMARQAGVEEVEIQESLNA